MVLRREQWLKGAIVAALLASWSPARLAAQDADAGNLSYLSGGCAACHGAEGQGLALGPALTGPVLPADAFAGYVRSPTGTMLEYSADAISDDALEAIRAWLESLAAEAYPAGNVQRGATLYRQNGCFQCHANEGQGGAQGPRLGPGPLSLARFIWYSRRPSGSMPPYTDVVMSDQDLADVHAFLAARPEPPALEDILLLAP